MHGETLKFVTDRFLQPTWNGFTVRYELRPYQVDIAFQGATLIQIVVYV